MGTYYCRCLVVCLTVVLLIGIDCLRVSFVWLFVIPVCWVLCLSLFCWYLVLRGFYVLLLWCVYLLILTVCFCLDNDGACTFATLYLRGHLF